MPLYVCRFCDYNTKQKKGYYYHLYKHINENNASFDKDELELCKFYHNKKTQIDKKYRKNNKERICQKEKEYYENNKDKESQRYKKYRENNKEHISQYNKEYCQNNKDRISQRKKEYHQNNKERIFQYNKEYRLRKKIKKEDANILDVYDSD